MHYNINAKGKILGRLASEVALILQGKKSVKYNPKDSGTDTVAITNAAQIVVTGDKARQKVYHVHTGYMGHLREKKFGDMMEKHPERIIEWAVYNMLPKNFLRQRRMNRLKITE